MKMSHSDGGITSRLISRKSSMSHLAFICITYARWPTIAPVRLTMGNYVWLSKLTSLSHNVSQNWFYQTHGCIFSLIWCVDSIKGESTTSHHAWNRAKHHSPAYESLSKNTDEYMTGTQGINSDAAWTWSAYVNAHWWSNLQCAKYWRASPL